MRSSLFALLFLMVTASCAVWDPDYEPDPDRALEDVLASARKEGASDAVTRDRVPFAERPFPHHQLVFPLAIPQQAQWSVLFRARGDNVIDFPLSIRAPDEFNQHDGYLKLSYGFYFGSVLIMCLFNLLIFFSIREPSYLLYVLYLGFFGLNLFAREGLAYQWLWPGASEWNHRSLPVLNLLTLAFSMFFSCSFLELKKAAPGLNRVLILIGLALIALAPFTLLNFTFFIQFSKSIYVVHHIFY